ncbi:Ig-like domain-containing protein, partial [Pectobacterium versatile]|uniref:Ig-like domain-containing protein n=1 Tax=Pectobacterium versatile TaxID=2488639 RepID=UPI001F1FD2D1
YGVDTVAPTASISIDNVTSDNVINASESGQTIAVTGQVGNEVKAGDAITVKVGTETYQDDGEYRWQDLECECSGFRAGCERRCECDRHHA